MKFQEGEKGKKRKRFLFLNDLRRGVKLALL